MATATLDRSVAAEQGSASVELLSFGEQTQALIDRLSEERQVLQDTIDKNSLFWGLGSRLPSYQFWLHANRVADIDKELPRLASVKQASDLGYEPYSPPDNWYVGLVSPKPERSERELIRSLTLVFNVPMPDAAIQALQKARETGLFAAFLVAAPDKAAFTQLDLTPRPRSAWFDPVLIGYIQTGETASIRNRRFGKGIGPGINTEGLTGFMIAQWDFEKDLRSMVRTPGMATR